LDNLRDVSRGLVVEVNQGIVEVFSNQQILENEAKKLHAQSAKFSKQASQWFGNNFFNFFFRVQLFTQLNQSIKELGDVENWSQHIDEDVQEIVKNIDVILELKQKK
jgi:biogenesis of lysosome-related organelles complex 1 subunit 1